MSHSDRLKAWAARKRERSQTEKDDLARGRSVCRVTRRGVAEPLVSWSSSETGSYIPRAPRSRSSKSLSSMRSLGSQQPKSSPNSPGTLTFAQCHAALSYYYLHQDEVDAELRRDREFNAPGVLAGTGRLPRLGLEELSGVIEG